MKYSAVRIESVTHHLPEHAVTSAELEARLAPLYDRLKLSPGRLEFMTGIRERRFWPPGTMPSTVAVAAGRKAIESAGIDKNRIGALIHASVSRDFVEPATAAVVHHKLGLRPDCSVFDISNACLGVLNGMLTVADMIELGRIEAGLIVSGENGGPLVENTIELLNKDMTMNRKGVKNSFASLTIGSGAAAVLLTHESAAKSGHKLIGGAVRSKTEFSALCVGNAAGGMTDTAHPVMATDSEELMRRGCELAGETWNALLTNIGWTRESVARIFTHQVGSAHQKLMFETIGMDQSRDFTTFEFLGNTGSAALPSTMSIGIERNPPGKTDRIALLGIGSGISCVMLGVEW